jgi:hypothetical protein
MKIIFTTRLNDGIFRVYRFSVVTPAQLHISDFIFPFYVYSCILDNPPGYLLFAQGTVFGALCTYVFLDLLGLLVCILPLFWALWFGIEDYRLVVNHEVGSISVFRYDIRSTTHFGFCI